MTTLYKLTDQQGRTRADVDLIAIAEEACS